VLLLREQRLLAWGQGRRKPGSQEPRRMRERHWILQVRRMRVRHWIPRVRQMRERHWIPQVHRSQGTKQ